MYAYMIPWQWKKTPQIQTKIYSYNCKNILCFLPCVSKYSSVLPTSKILFTPADTTVTGVRPSSTRSAEMSRVLSAPRWTPPMPPVTKIGMPTLCATTIVPDTVVPPVRPWWWKHCHGWQKWQQAVQILHLSTISKLNVYQHWFQFHSIPEATYERELVNLHQHISFQICKVDQINA